MKTTHTLAVILALAFARIAEAQSACDAGKLKEYGKGVFCLAKLDAKAAKTATPVDPLKVQKCVEKLALKCAAAEAKGDCTSAVKSCSELGTEADECRDAANGPPCGQVGNGVCGGSCPVGETCSPTSTTQGCACQPEVTGPCAPLNGVCGGECPTGEICGNTPTGCACLGSCGLVASGFCGGVCLGGQTCRMMTTGGCGCS